MRSHVTLLQGTVMSCIEYKPPYIVEQKLHCRKHRHPLPLNHPFFPLTAFLSPLIPLVTCRVYHSWIHPQDVHVLAASPERGVDLQGFAQHLGSDVVHVVPAQVDFSQAGVAAQSVDEHGASRAQARVSQGQSLQGL